MKEFMSDPCARKRTSLGDLILEFPEVDPAAGHRLPPRPEPGHRIAAVEYVSKESPTARGFFQLPRR